VFWTGLVWLRSVASCARTQGGGGDAYTERTLFLTAVCTSTCDHDIPVSEPIRTKAIIFGMFLTRILRLEGCTLGARCSVVVKTLCYSLKSREFAT
jgi:hypothetical protein